jgi:uncharacterized protein YlxP (DUF503 family)
MVVGTGRMLFRLYDCRSLKEKRSVVKAIIHRLRNSFNASVAETGHNDTLTLAEIGFSVTGNDRRVVNGTVDRIMAAADAMNLAPLVETDMEIISF